MKFVILLRAYIALFGKEFAKLFVGYTERLLEGKLN